MQRLDEWVTEQDPAWLDALEDCPDQLMPWNPNPVCDNGLWTEPVRAAEHANAWCIRSKVATPGGAGQQVSTALHYLFLLHTCS